MNRYLVVDDEEDARGIIKHLMSEFFPKWNFCGEANNPENAVDLINNNEPDLVFMDIKLHKDNGFDILAKTNYFDFYTIMVTAYSEYSIKAFNYNVSGYLLKPLDILEFKNAVNKVNNIVCEEIKVPARPLKSNKIKLHTIDCIHVIDSNDIVRIEAEGNYSFFYLSSGEKHLICKYLKEVEEMVDRNSFLRVHNSHIINLNHLKAFVKEEGGHLIMTDGSKVPVSRRKKEVLLDFLA